MKFNDILVALMLLAVSIALFVSSRGLPTFPGQTVGPALFPTTVSVLLGLASMALLLRSLRAGNVGPLVTLNAGFLKPKQLLIFSSAPISVVFYLYSVDRLGFVICSFLILIFMMLMFKTRITLALAIAVSMSVISYLLFAGILLVPLPQGPIDLMLSGFIHAL